MDIEFDGAAPHPQLVVDGIQLVGIRVGDRPAIDGRVEAIVGADEVSVGEGDSQIQLPLIRQRSPRPAGIEIVDAVGMARSRGQERDQQEAERESVSNPSEHAGCSYLPAHAQYASHSHREDPGPGVRHSRNRPAATFGSWRSQKFVLKSGRSHFDLLSRAEICEAPEGASSDEPRRISGGQGIWQGKAEALLRLVCAAESLIRSGRGPAAESYSARESRRPR